MRDTDTTEVGQDTPSADAVEPSAAGSKPIITNPVGYDFVLGEIAERNPIVRHALLRRARNRTG
jgi:hypothetical protein